MCLQDSLQARLPQPLPKAGFTFNFWVCICTCVMFACRWRTCHHWKRWGTFSVPRWLSSPWQWSRLLRTAADQQQPLQFFLIFSQVFRTLQLLHCQSPRLGISLLIQSPGKLIYVPALLQVLATTPKGPPPVPAGNGFRIF